MCLGFEEWWLYKCFKSPKRVIFNLYAQIIPREFLVDTTYVHMYVLHKADGKLRLSIFIGVDILVVLISEFVVVAILSEWWLLYLSGGHCQPLRPLWAHPCYL